MPTFNSQPLQPSPLSRTISTRLRQRPFLYFGFPFLTLVVFSSFGLETFTRTRYDLHKQKVQSVTKEEELGMSKDRKRVDIKEEYYRLQNLGSSATSSLSLSPSDDWTGESVRVPRPASMPEWGPAKTSVGDAPVLGTGEREGDRLV